MGVAIVIPDGWEAITLRDCGKWLSGGTPPRDNPEYWGGDIPWISAKSMHSYFISESDDKITPEGAAYSRIIPTDSLLILVRGMMLHKRLPLGIAIRPVTFNQDVRALVPNEQVDSRYLLYWLLAHESEILEYVEESSHGTGRIPSELLLGTEVGIPPLPEQRRIAEILGSWDDAIALTGRLIDALKRRKQGLIQRLLTGEVRFASFEGQQWQESEFAEILKIAIGGTPARNNPDFWDVNKVRNNVWLSIADLNKKYISDSKEYISDLGVQHSNAKLFDAGTVVMSFKLTIGRAGILVRPAYTNEAICALIPLDEQQVWNPYLYHALSVVRFDEEMDQAIKGQTLNKDKLSRLMLQFPSISEQQEIADLLDLADTEIDICQAVSNGLQRQKNGLMQRLLTGQIRVGV